MPSLPLKSAAASDNGLRIAFRLIFALPCLAFAIWGVWICRTAVRSFLPVPDFGLSRVAEVLSWLVFFAPFAVMGALALAHAARIFHHARTERRRAAPVQILPPASIYRGFVQPAASLHTPVASAAAKPIELDDLTRSRLDTLAARLAITAGIVFGLLFLGAGVLGLALAWIQGHSPARFSFPLYFLVSYGISVLLGAFILRETFARPRTAWLAPLQVLGFIIAGRAPRSSGGSMKNDAKLPQGDPHANSG